MVNQLSDYEQILVDINEDEANMDKALKEFNAMNTSI